MSSDIDTAFDAPWIEPVPGFGDVKFARADCDYWAAWAEQIKKQRIAASKVKLATIPMIDPMRRADYELKIEDQKVYLGEVLDLQGTPAGLKKILIDSMVAAGIKPDEAEKIRKRIGPGRQSQIATIICSEPVPTIEEYRESVRKLCAKRTMSADQIMRLTDADMIRILNETADSQKPPEGEPELFQEGAEPQTDTPK